MLVLFSKLSKVNLFYVMGVFLIIAQGFIFSAAVHDPSVAKFLFWSCNNFSIFMLYACYRQDMQMLKGFSYLGLVSQLLWISDFTSHLFGFNLSGITDYIYLEGFTYANEVSIGVHMIVPLAVLIFSARFKPGYRSLVVAFSYIILIYIATILFTPPVEDINCVFNGCGNGRFVPFNIYLWPVYAILSVLIAWGIHYLVYLLWTKPIVVVRALFRFSILKSQIMYTTSMKKEFTATEAKSLGEKIGIDFNTYNLEEFRLGLSVELEHGSADPETNVTNDDEVLTAKITWAHLKEIPDYYTRLLKMEKEAGS